MYLIPKIYLLLLLECFSGIGMGQEQSFAYYQQLNQQETRLAKYKDSDEILLLKLKQLDIINASRLKHKVQTLDLDILASRVANQIAIEAADNKFMGHWNMAGENSWIRFANAGGQHHVVENASSISSDGILNMENDNILSYMKSCHDAFMAERKPMDGHKQNCIDPFHTHVGIGIAWTNKEFRYYENFLDVYLNISHANTPVEVNSECKIDFSIKDKTLHLYSIVVYYEPFPQKMTPHKISQLTEYPDYGKKTVIQLPPWELPQLNNDDTYQFTFVPQKQGYYYCQIFLSPKAYKKGNASTKGKIQASGLVIRAQ